MDLRISSRLAGGVIAAVLLVAWAGAEERIWTDKTGKFQLSAEMVDVVDGKVRLKRPDGRIVSVPVERLSDADQQFLKQGGGDGDAAWRVGDKAYLQTRGQWQLGVLTKIHDGPGSARYEITLKTGSKRAMRVTEQRLRRYGKAGDHGLLLPGDVVEILDTWGKEVVNTGVIVRVSGSRAYVKPEGELAEKSYWLKSLRAPGAADDSSLAGRVASAEASRRKPGEKPHPADKLTYPEDPTLTDVNPELAPLLDLDGSGGAPSSVRLSVAAPSPPVDRLRPLPVSLVPKRHSFDKAAFSIAENLDLAAVLRTTWSPKHSQLELAPLRKTRAKNQFLGMPPGTLRAELAPGADWLMSRRDDPPRIDVWEILWADGERKQVNGLEHRVSWAPGDTEDSWFRLKQAGWVDDEKLLTIDSKNNAVLWRAATAEPLRRLALGGSYALLRGTPYAVVNRGPRGVSVVNLGSMRVEAVVGVGGVAAGSPSLSPSGRWLLLSGRGGALEIWDLHSGERTLRTLLVSTDKNEPLNLSSAAWSEEEPYLRGGGYLIDVRTWQTQRPPRGAAARSRTGLAWSLGAGRKNEPVLTAVRAPRPVADDAVRPNAGGPFLLKRGDPIAVDVTAIDRSIADAARRKIGQMIRDQGYRVADESPFVVKAGTKSSTQSREYGRGMFPRAGQKGNFTVSFQVREYRLALRRDGVELTSSSGGQSAEPVGRYKSEQELRAAARRRLEWDAELFSRLALPETVIAVTPASG